jgi:hypothetical protein
MPDDDVLNEAAAESDNNGHPAWAPILESVPSQFHEALRPKLEEWDTGVQQRFQKVHSDYEDWRTFRDAGVKPEQVNTALGFVQALEANPTEVLEALQTYYKQQGIIQEAATGIQQQSQQQGQPVLNGNGDQQEELDPRIAAKLSALEQQNTTLAQVLLRQQEQEAAKIEDQKLDQELAKLHKAMTKEYGFDFNDRALLGYAKGFGVDIGEAAKLYYQDAVQLRQSARPPAPSLLGSGGNLPSNQVSLAGKTQEELNAIAVERLRQYRQQSD